MIEHILRYALPAAYALLPAPMQSPAASALLLSIGLQESKFLERRQRAGGPARGFWMFEKSGLTGVIKHPATAGHLEAALRALRYDGPITARLCLTRVQHNDPLAAVFARLLLWTLPDKLPERDAPGVAWTQYLKLWRPGKPIKGTWGAHYAHAWDLVEGTRA